MRKKSSGYTFLDMAKEVMEIEKKPLTVAQIVLVKHFCNNIT